ncbi:MAG: glutamine-hydrolyzing carbamoyl-phosphate synthase small subunit [Deltaproteobacteria bacterium]|nr:glutamine-hydrolyzing carbamoyl-phosphate synthase small subunit [Deltaproteobacteria bacterium]
MTEHKPAALVLESGRVFHGEAFGADGNGFGEVVFNTSMTGYQEVTTDPSYAGQIVVMTSTQIGNVGVNEEDNEASAPACVGFVVRELSALPSSWRSHGDLASFLREHGVVGITGVDTRAVTRAIREHGAQRGVVAHQPTDIDGLIAKVKDSPTMQGQDLVPQVTCEQAYTWDQGPWVAPGNRFDLPPASHHVVAFDFGIKREILRDLRAVGCRVTVVPATTSAADALALGPDGIFLSNGPGDPAAVTYAQATVAKLIESGKPVFGICLGHQILSLALGAKTFKLPFGHHGGNHPVKDLATGKVEITSQNHGFAVSTDDLPAGTSITHINLYDQTVEGIRLDDKPVFGIQYHPEAAPGPHDAAYLFERFAEAMRSQH